MYGWLRRRFSEAKSIEQSGKGNSQYGTRWYHNPKTQENKKIKDIIPIDLIPGKYKEPEIIKVNKKDLNKEKNIELYRKYYQIYKQTGFDEFVKITGYQYSQPNLVQRFAKLLDDFLPQNGKKR